MWGGTGLNQRIFELDLVAANWADGSQALQLIANELGFDAINLYNF